MKCFQVCLILVTLVAIVVTEVPSGAYLPSGWKPTGRRLILPSRQQSQRVYGPPPAEYGAPQASSTTAEPTTAAPTTTESVTTDAPTTEQHEDVTDPSETKGQSEQLKIADNGIYYVLHPDGRLQRVEFMTSPLVKQTEQIASSSETNGQSEQIKNSDNGSYYVLHPDGRLQRVEYMTSPLVEQPSRQTSYLIQKYQSALSSQLQTRDFQETPIVRYVQVHPKQQQVPQHMMFNGFVANIQYTDVEPISGPVYAYNPAPLIRILKK